MAYHTQAFHHFTAGGDYEILETVSCDNLLQHVANLLLLFPLKFQGAAVRSCAYTAAPRAGHRLALRAKGA